MKHGIYGYQCGCRCDDCWNTYNGYRRDLYRRNNTFPDLPPLKDEAPCCNSKRDSIGRLPIGFCGPDCVRRRSA